MHGCSELIDTGGAIYGQVLPEESVVTIVGIAEGKPAGRRPSEKRNVEHWTMVGSPQNTIQVRKLTIVEDRNAMGL
jgi:hypothetical protein